MEYDNELEAAATECQTAKYLDTASATTTKTNF
jgi:hypothetical protein